MLFAFIVAICAIFADQMMKLWVISILELHQSMSGVRGLFDLYYIQNEGASWGILAGQRTFFIVLTVAAVCYLVHLIMKEQSKLSLTLLAYGLLLGGAIGNLIDRIRLGYVIDMIRLSFIEFPIFNIADACLTIGVILLIVDIVLAGEKERFKNAGI